MRLNLDHKFTTFDSSETPNQELVANASIGVERHFSDLEGVVTLWSGKVELPRFFRVITKRNHNMATQEKLHIGQMIKAVFDESGLSVAELARRIHTARSNVYFIFERPSIDINQLLDLCDALNHNFLDDIQLFRGMKSNLCPREIQIDLHLDDLSDEEAVRVRHFLEELKGKSVCNFDGKY